MPRPRKGGPRERNGRQQRNRAAEEAEAISVVIGARQRVFGLTLGEARRLQETSNLARLRLDDSISERQLRAAWAYQELMRDYDRLFPLRPVQLAGDLDRMSGYDDSGGADAAYIEMSNHVLRRYSACRQALVDADKVDFRASGTVRRVALEGIAQPHLSDALRVGLNALATAVNIPLDE